MSRADSAGPIVLRAQQRDTTAPERTGTAVIAGAIVSDDSQHKPLRRANVTLVSGDLRVPMSTVTDDDGRFVFTGVPAGNYTITSSKLGYVGGFYGARTPGRGPGVPIAVLDGQQITGLTMRMLHGSVITGVVRQPNGRPAPGVEIIVMGITNVGGQRTIEPAGGATETDDRGVYRVFGLAPGTYVVQTQSTDEFIGALIGGGAGDTRQVTQAEVAWAGQASSGGAGTSPPPPPAPGPTVTTSAPVYYPGTTDAGAAAPIKIGPNEERSGVDFALEAVPTARIAGTVVDQQGQPIAGAQLSVTSAQPDSLDIIALLLGRIGTRSGADGTFSIPGLTPGRYEVSARGAPPRPGERPAASNDAVDRAAAVLSLLGRGGGAGATLWARQEVSVDGRDMAGLLLTLQPGMALSGKIVFDATSMTPPADLTMARVSLSAAPTGPSPMALVASMVGGTNATVGADGAFSLSGVAPGAYSLRITVPGMLLTQTSPAGWVLRSLTVGGRDVSDLPFEVKPNENVTGIVATFTDRPTELSGTLQDQAGRVASSYPIIVFSTDRRYWTVGSRRVQQVHPSNDGKFRLVGLPAGEYYVCAVVDLDQNQLYDPAFLDQLAAASFKISLAEGEKKVQDLKLSGGG